MCGSKRRYSKRGAKKAHLALKARGDGGVLPYRCPSCDWWHVGHRPQSQQPADTTVVRSMK